MFKGYFLNIFSIFFCLFQAVAAASSGGLNDAEKREKKALEKKLMEMEEELKVRTERKLVRAPFHIFAVDFLSQARRRTFGIN